MHHPELIRKLLEPAAYPHGVHDLQVIETHISWVILTGEYAYKVKKPVTLGFLDFSSMGQSRQSSMQFGCASFHMKPGWTATCKQV
jgi:aminoglycoside phosphotransferase family enzyme